MSEREHSDQEDDVSRRSFMQALGAGGVVSLGEYNLSLQNQNAAVKVLVGSRDQLPEPEQGENRLFFALDTGERFWDEGSEWTSLDIAAEHADFDQLTADIAQIQESLTQYQPNRGLSDWYNGGLQSQRRVIAPSFTRSENNPIFTPEDASWNITSGEVHWPQVIRTDNLDDPRSEYYMYYVPHDINGLSVAFADHPEGPWTDYEGNPIIPGGGEPGAFYNAEEDEVWIYYNRPNSTTRLVRSPNGVTDWTNDGVVFTINREGHTGYPRVLQTPQGIYLTSWNGVQGPMSKPTIRFSEDGKSNWRWIEPTMGVGNSPTGERLNRYHDGITMMPFRNGYYCAWSHHKAVNDRNILHGFTQNGQQIKEYGILMEGGGQDWENNVAAEPDFVWDREGNLWMFYMGDTGSNWRIGVAKADFSEVRL